MMIVFLLLLLLYLCTDKIISQAFERNFLTYSRIHDYLDVRENQNQQQQKKTTNNNKTKQPKKHPTSKQPTTSQTHQLI